jgi:secreted trypsin-like serine protease
MSALQTTSIETDTEFIKNQMAADPTNKRIVGGVPTRDFPECVAVGSRDDYCCTGTLIAPQAVLTAGHCAAGGCSKRIFIGYNIKNAGTETEVWVQEAITHPAYVPDSAAQPYDDLTVLILTKPVIGVKPVQICSLEAIAAATSVTLVGFGNTDFNGLDGYGIKRMVEVGLASEDSRYGARFETEFVAGAMFLDQDTCTGDSGGPAYVMVDGGRQLAGATSRATREGERPCGDGGVYTRVPAYREWLESVVGRLG